MTVIGRDLMLDDWRVLLQGTVGSHAYGLNHAESDVDLLAVGIAPTEQFLGLAPPTRKSGTRLGQSIGQDSVTHELGKYCALALQCNPTILDLLWLESRLYSVRTPVGNELIYRRQEFLSRGYVRNAYLGYATQQFNKLQRRGDGTFSSDVRNRSAKHARHIYRLVEQGFQLYTTGSMQLMMDKTAAERCRDFAEKAVDAPVIAINYLADQEKRFDGAECALPERPQTERFEQWLRDVRKKELHRREALSEPILG